MSYLKRVNLLLETMRARLARIVFVFLVTLFAVLSTSCLVALSRMAGEVFAQGRNGFLHKLEYVDPPRLCGRLWIRYSYMPALAPCEIERRRLWFSEQRPDYDPCAPQSCGPGCVAHQLPWLDASDHSCGPTSKPVHSIERPAGMYIWQNCVGWLPVYVPKRGNG